MHDVGRELVGLELHLRGVHQAASRRARSTTTGAVVKLTITTSTVHTATPAVAVNACAQPTLAPLSDDDGAM